MKNIKNIKTHANDKKMNKNEAHVFYDFFRKEDYFLVISGQYCATLKLTHWVFSIPTIANPLVPWYPSTCLQFDVKKYHSLIFPMCVYVFLFFEDNISYMMPS
ncbi:hypothetical protein RFI_21870 [Reticulomyxa filosa]|uniref:Uncharacterized protein n=1 Tax=Reticulomyxa filosa TaxID=46433 RepID=X6MNS4_RETFI|nr:hypothetical protein RFI_21870 [Reticulomyxa filosa]|eukprot:ETO15494.1 hypothetical protein RFI_21870 [Reticulomyxa filosa]